MQFLPQKQSPHRYSRSTLSEEKSASIQWVKTHKGTDGKEKANKLAKLSPTLDTTMDPGNPQSGIKLLLRNKILKYCQQKWGDDNTKGRFAQMTVPNVSLKRLGPNHVIIQLIKNRGAFPTL